MLVVRPTRDHHRPRHTGRPRRHAQARQSGAQLQAMQLLTWRDDRQQDPQHR